ncbi:hypothetical protein fugu_013505 [Takifugu bimaculatus]|uniref:Uncharacterized protein n=1 Tax=Takifugu bimaculatus TaxID=433685 RepID=A0A4Z2C3E1_9TELE|nr:hypothetical protein fugu_013505 [Takifugu bimaculatus]
MTSGPPRRDFGLITLTSRQLVHVEHLQDTHMSHKCLVYVTREPKHTHLISSLSAGLAGVSEAEGVGVFEEADSSSCVTLPAPPVSCQSLSACPSPIYVMAALMAAKQPGSSDSSHSDGAVITRR